MQKIASKILLAKEHLNL